MFGFFSSKCSAQVAVDNKHLRKLVTQHIARHGPRCDLNHIDVSNINDFTGVFANTSFDGNVFQWNTSRAISMQEMFASTPFNGDISNWDVSSVIDMSRMFCKSLFNGDISKWNVSRVTSMHSMFANSLFNSDISKWDVSNVALMNAMFMSSAFSGDLADWNVSNVADMSMMFHGSLFWGDVSKWDLGALRHATHMFDSPYFKSDIPAFKLNELLTGSSMVSAAFQGRLSSEFQDYTSVRKMFSNVAAANNYLCYLFKSVGPGAVHIDYALQNTECPSWFTPELFAWVKREQAMCAQLGINAQAVRELVTNDFFQGSCNDQRDDSIPFEFEAVRTVA